VIKTKNSNVRIVAQGLFQADNKVGIQFGLALPHVHVVRWQGLCYLHNGFHRALGCRAAGATHMPCLFRDVATAEEVGLGPGKFPAALLQSANPPTVGAMTKIMVVNWAEHVMPDE
jgi:hypothetical protein